MLQIRGNLRAKREDVLDLVTAGVEKHFGEASPACLDLPAEELSLPNRAFLTCPGPQDVAIQSWMRRVSECIGPAGDKCKVLMREDPEAEEQDARGQPRIAFELMPTSVVETPEPPGWQRFAAGVLLLFTAATALQIGLVANVSRLPKVQFNSSPLLL